MGGEGAMMQANQSLKSNRSLASKRKERSLSFISTNTEKPEYDFPESTPEIIERIRNKTIEENKKRRKRSVITFTVFFSIIILLAIFLL